MILIVQKNIMSLSFTTLFGIGLTLIVLFVSPVYADLPEMPLNARAGQFTGFKPCINKTFQGVNSENAECGVLVVPENRDKPAGRLIALPVIRLPATSSKPGDPIIILNGGPGGTNLKHPINSEEIFRQYDILLLGYRGVDDEHPLNCPEISQAVLVSQPLSPVARKGIANAAVACAKRLTDEGIDLAKYRMVDVIEDFEDLRRALGHQQFNPISISYGTRIAQYYTRLYPASVARSVQVAVNPPGHFQWFPGINHRIMQLYSELCAQDTYCKSRTEDLLGDSLAILSRDDLTWNGEVIDMDRVRVSAFMMLMSKHSAVRFYDAVLDAKEGDTGNLYKLSRFYDAMINVVVWGDMFSKGGVDYVDIDLEEFVRLRETTHEQLGSPFDLLLSSGVGAWPVQPPPKGFDKAALDKTETLLVNGDLDMSTPLEPIDDELLKYLPNGHLVITRHFGHNDIRTQHEVGSLGSLIAGFLADGTVDASIIEFRRVDFNVDEKTSG